MNKAKRVLITATVLTVLFSNNNASADHEGPVSPASTNDDRLPTEMSDVSMDDTTFPTHNDPPVTVRTIDDLTIEIFIDDSE